MPFSSDVRAERPKRAMGPEKVRPACQRLLAAGTGLLAGVPTALEWSGISRKKCWLEELQDLEEECGFELLSLDLPHLLTLEQFPLHHRDPFDRLLVAQSISESLLLVSADGAFPAYGCPLQDVCR